MTKLRMRAIALGLVSVFCVFCNRTVGGGAGNVATPGVDGARCNNDIECASDFCALGTCQPAVPGLVEVDGDCSSGAACVADATCQDGICVETAAACAPLLGACAVNDDCCSGACDNGQVGGAGCAACCFDTCPGDDSCDGCFATGRCTGGSGMCSGEGGQCDLDSDCCVGRCDFHGSAGGVSGACSTSCKGHGESCTVGECCSGYCDGESQQCYDCLTGEAPAGTGCLTDADCCGETCKDAFAGDEGSCYQ